MTNEQNAAAKFSQLVEDFKKATKDAVDSAINEIHSEFVPYLNDDTQNNAIYRANDILRMVLEGNFEVTDTGWIVVDGWNITQIDGFSHNKMIDALADKCSDMAAKARISKLEDDLERAYCRNL